MFATLRICFVFLSTLILAISVVPVSGRIFTAPSSSATAIQVGENVRITAEDSERYYADPTIHAHPKLPHKMLMCGLAFSPKGNDRTAVTYVSGDDGRTWKKTFESDPAARPNDPICELAANGTAYHLISPRVGTRDTVRLLLYRSPDDGEHWEQVSDWPYTDRPSLSVDSTVGPFRDRVYIHGTGYVQSIDEAPPMRKGVRLWRSTDQGRTVLGPSVRMFLNREYPVVSSNSVILADGTWVTAIAQWHSVYSGYETSSFDPVFLESTPNHPNGALQIVRSTDGGEAISSGVKVDDWYSSGRPPKWPGFSTLIPELASDNQSIFRNSVYVVWPDLRNGRTEIRFSYSRNGGRTWSRSIVVNDDHDDGPHHNHLNPMIAVNASGVIGIAWYDRRDAADNLGYSVRFTASLDGGETFLPSVLVSSQPRAFNAADRIFTGSVSERGEYAGFSVNVPGFQYSGGDFSNMTTNAANDFYPVWIDNRTGVSQAWTAPIHVTGEVTHYGDRAWSDLTDVTRGLTVELTEHSFDLKDGVLVVKARLRNESGSSICKPIVLRAVTLQSWTGRPGAVNSDNGVAGPGAAWNFDDALVKPCLGNGESSGTRELRFRLNEVRYPNEGMSRNGSRGGGLLKLEGRIFAAPPKPS